MKKLFFTLPLLVITFNFCSNYDVEGIGDNKVIVNRISMEQSVDVSFGKKKTNGHPEVFGVVIKSPASEAASFQMLKDYGVNLVRATIPFYCILPEGITLSDYKNNVNDVQNPDNWPGWGVHWGGNGDFSWALKMCKEVGLKTMASISYCPEWLAWGAGGAKPFHRVPRDWDVNKDLYQKAFLRHREYIDIVGISNEPNFLEIDGSPYDTAPDAYKDMFKNASAAIRELDPNVKIVGPELAYSWNGSQGVKEYPESLEFVRKIVNAPDIPKGNLNAITYHHYYDGADIGIMKGITDLPIYVTEWNAGSNVANNTDPFMSGSRALSWAGNTLIRLLNQGADASLMYCHYPRPLADNRSGTYEWDAANSKPIPQLKMRAFALLSKSLKLGEGMSEIHHSTTQGVSNALGAINSAREYVVAIPNMLDSTLTVAVNITDLPFDGGVDIYFYEASDTADVFSPYKTQIATVSRGMLSFTLSLPPYSVGGVRVVPTTARPPADPEPVDTPSNSGDVALSGTWIGGSSLTLPEGKNRVIIFTAHVEHNANISLNSVYFAGRPMTKIADQATGTGYRSYVATFYLAESDFPSNSSGDFTTVWSATPRNEPSYSCAVFENVDQAAPVSCSQSVGVNGITIQTPPLATSPGDMVVLASTTGESGSYIMYEGFVKVREVAVISGSGVVAQREGNGKAVVAKIAHTIPFRQALVAFVLKKTAHTAAKP